MLENLKNSAYRGRDEYPETLTSAYEILVRESGEFNTSKPREQNFQRCRGRGGGGGGGRGGRGRGGRSFTFTKTGRGPGNGGRSNGIENEDNENMVQGRDGKKPRTLNVTNANFSDILLRNAQKVATQEQTLRRLGMFLRKFGITKKFQGHGCFLIPHQR